MLRFDLTIIKCPVLGRWGKSDSGMSAKFANVFVLEVKEREAIALLLLLLILPPPLS